MKPISLIAAGITFSLLSIHTAQAYDGPCCRGDTPQWYVGLIGSMTYLDDVDLGQTFLNPATSNLFDSTSFDPGIGLGGMIGYRFWPNISGELEVVHRSNDLDKIGADPFTAPSGFYSAQKSTSVMANMIYTYTQMKPIQPYFGAGAGMVHVKNPGILTSGSEVIKLTDWLFGYQFMMGANYPLVGTPFELALGYRYMTTEEGEKAFASDPTTKFKWDNTTHNLDLTAKMNF